ncbi:hypothetical protein [Roseivirga pacifica]|uniref:hypothetical protein n=1 Tax=Roseivirga pacifica TaxID=1267423 RepID=UPI0020965DB1|nr:hypothetical protein [Roseivirga pacifica]MCO6359650.1 hypothetical protein [Roseivirga pacifica]MCO6367020.1 hypothetical protein [Roseivirga pacifica]MCO6370448.1 hypothetical protein [Roseivirga pacifica]MCO6374677.1 hypothetical protein [Roseivirga pacifica]MCO6379935.1 hypothetical protein [Roseivirga pacifica]
MTTRTSLAKKWLFASILIIIASVIILYKGWLKKMPQDYTVGEVTEIYHPGKGNKQAVFIYKVKGNAFENQVSIQEGQKPEVGEKYIVQFPEKFNGKHGLMRLDLPVGGDLVPPKDGWTELPTSVL